MFTRDAAPKDCSLIEDSSSTKYVGLVTALASNAMASITSGNCVTGSALSELGTLLFIVKDR